MEESKMSNLEELKNKLCPNGVEFVKLGEVCKRQKGINITAFQMKELNKDNGEIRIFAGGNTIANVNYEDIPNANIINIPSIIVKSRGKVDFEYYDKPFTHKNELWSYSKNSDDINLKFIYYYLCNNLDYFIKKSVRGAMPQIATPDTDNFEIPIPPLEVQEEIVRILDPLTKDVNELIDLLKKEQELRKKQYSYYRDKLLTFDEYTPKIKLGEVCEKIKNINWKKENNISKKYIDLSSVSREFHEIIDNEVKEVNSENAPSRARQIIKINDILFGTTRPMLKRYCIVPEKYDDQICSTGFCVLRIVNKDVLVNFIYHCLSTSNFYNFIEDNEQGTTYPAISDNILKEYKIPFPPIEKQKEIVTILDSLEKYYNNLQESLPAEIEKRKKQYEFYRDKLLTFEKNMSR